MADELTNSGLVGRNRKVTLDQIEGHQRSRTVGEVAHWCLSARRCPDCGHDVVVELDSGVVWDLDLSDYGDGGSANPDGVAWGDLRAVTPDR